MDVVAPDAAQIRFHAERRIGQLMASQKQAGLMAQGKRNDLALEKTQVANPTLADAGINKNLADSLRANFKKTVRIGLRRAFPSMPVVLSNCGNSAVVTNLLRTVPTVLSSTLHHSAIWRLDRSVHLISRSKTVYQTNERFNHGNH